MNIKYAIAPFIALVSACASLAPPVPDEYKGPVVLLDDSGYPESGGKGVFFVASALDGRGINNSLRETRLASSGRGFSLSPHPL